MGERIIMPKAAAKQSAGARRRPAERTASRQLTATTRRTPGLTASSRTSPRGHKELNQSSRLEAPAATPTQLYEQWGLHESDRITVATIQPHSTTKRWSTPNAPAQPAPNEEHTEPPVGEYDSATADELEQEEPQKLPEASQASSYVRYRDDKYTIKTYNDMSPIQTLKGTPLDRSLDSIIGSHIFPYFKFVSDATIESFCVPCVFEQLEWTVHDHKFTCMRYWNVFHQEIKSRVMSR